LISWVVPIVAALILIQVPLAGATCKDQWDPTDNSYRQATRLLDVPRYGQAARTQGPHTLCSTDTVDWFTFRLLAGCTYQFKVINKTGSLNAALCTMVNGQEPRSVSGGSASGGTPTVNYPVPCNAGGSYYLKVSGCTGGTCSYTLQYSCTAERPLGDPWDRYDGFGVTRSSLSITTTVQFHGPHTLSADCDTADWFSVYLSSSSKTYQFYTSPISINTGRMSVELYDESNRPVAPASTQGSSFSLEYTSRASGVYYLRVFITSGKIAMYTLAYKQK
jgi:hypothetical protein